MSQEATKKRADEIWKFVESPDEYMDLIQNADLEVLQVLIARLGSTGSIGATFDALRDATTAVINTRLSTKQVDATNRLNKSTTRLAIVGIVLTVVGLLLALTQAKC